MEILSTPIGLNLPLQRLIRFFWRSFVKILPMPACLDLPGSLIVCGDSINANLPEGSRRKVVEKIGEGRWQWAVVFCSHNYKPAQNCTILVTSNIRLPLAFLDNFVHVQHPCFNNHHKTQVTLTMEEEVYLTRWWYRCAMLFNAYQKRPLRQKGHHFFDNIYMRHAGERSGLYPSTNWRAALGSKSFSILF